MTTDGASLFKDFSAGGGSYFRAKDGDMFIGVFTGVSDAGESSYEGKAPTKGIWWHFDLYQFSDPTKRVLFTPEDGPDKGKEIEASVDGRTTTETGPKSKARAWFSAILQKEIPNDADKAAIFAEALGKRVLVHFGKSDDGTKIVVKNLIPFKG